MSTNGMNMSEDAEMADCNGDKVVTMMDVLQEQQDFEEDANAVLGASDDKNCTYTKGYVKRQAIYACLTCCPDATTDPMKRAGICLACSLACHENHELVELYTKRNFRCDCGNPKFTQPCQFTPNKTDLNYENKYNQNFSGIYCSCKRPYPDPEATEEEEMIQCIVCEDWHHTNHLEATIPNNDQYAEMICKDCMEDIDFLHDYSDLVVNVEDKEIIVMDPDLDVSSIIKANEISMKEELSNSTAEIETSKDKEALIENLNNVDGNKKEEASADVEMNIGEPDKCGDGSDASKEEKEKSEQNLQNEASGDANTTVNADESSKVLNTDESSNADESSNILNADESSKVPESDNDDKKENNIDQKTDKECNVNSSKENITEVEKIDSEETIVENKENEAIPSTGDGDDLSKAEGSETTVQVEKSEADSVTDAKDDKAVTPTDDVSHDADKAITPTDDISHDADKAVTPTDDVSPDTDKPEAKDEAKEDGSNETSDKENEIPTNSQEHKRKLSVEDIEVSPKKKKFESKPCVRPRGVKRVYKGATFWPSTFRQKLCTCSECLAMYKDLAVLFLTDLEDTVTAYEALGKENDGALSSQYEKGLQALSSLDRIQQINALTEYNKMRDKLLDFLKSFKDRKEIVKEEDIKAFFAGMKPKREPDGVYFCR